MGTAALTRQHVSRRPARLLLPAPREESRRPGASNILAFHARPIRPGRRFRPGVVFPVAGLLLVLAVVPAVGTLSEKRPAPIASASPPGTAEALAGLPDQRADPEGRAPRGAAAHAQGRHPSRRAAARASSRSLQRYGVSVDALISFNNITRARSLQAGVELQVPNADGLAYTVRRGDSLRGIAARYGVSLESLLDWNRIESEVIHAGQSLFVPGARLPASVRESVLGKLMVFPTRGELSSRFGWRQNPFTGLREHHNGLDIGAPVGTPVVAAMAGRVAAVGISPVYGRYVILAHAGGLQTLYGHLNRALVSRGADGLAGPADRRGRQYRLQHGLASPLHGVPQQRAR